MESTSNRATTQKETIKLTHLFEKRVGTESVYSATLIFYQRGKSKRYYYTIVFDKHYFETASRFGSFTDLETCKDNALKHYLNICKNVWELSKMMAAKLNKLFNTDEYSVSDLPLEWNTNEFRT